MTVEKLIKLLQQQNYGRVAQIVVDGERRDIGSVKVDDGGLTLLLQPIPQWDRNPSSLD